MIFFSSNRSYIHKLYKNFLFLWFRWFYGTLSCTPWRRNFQRHRHSIINNFYL